MEMKKETEKTKVKEEEKETNKVQGKEKLKVKENEKETNLEQKNLTIDQATDYFTSIYEFYPFFLSEFYNLNMTPFDFTFDFENKNDNNNNNKKHNIQKIGNNNQKNTNTNINNNKKKKKNDNDDHNNDNNKKPTTKNNNKIQNKPTTNNNNQKSSEQFILTITKAKRLLKTYNQNNLNNLIDFFLENNVSGFYQTNPLLFISNLFHISQKLSKK